jgi:hypothetical protein
MSPELARAIRRIAPFAFAGVGLAVILFASMSFIGSEGFAFDFRAYDLAARRIAAGDHLYLADTVDRYNSGSYAGLYLYPPQMAIALVPFTAFTPGTAAIVWLWFRVFALAFGCAVMPVRGWVRLVTFGMAAFSFPVLYDLNLGNVSAVVFALSAVIWRLGPRPAAGALLAVLIAIRYPFAAVAIAWLAMRRWRVLAVMMGTGLILLALALPIVGFAGYVDYVTILRGLRDISTGPDNLSLTASLGQAGVPDGIARVAGLAGMAAAAGVTWWVGWKRDPETAIVVALTAPLLVAPFFHPHYLVALLIPGAFLAHRGRPWAVALPLLGWLSGPLLPLVAAVAIVGPLIARPAPADPSMSSSVPVPVW